MRERTGLIMSGIWTCKSPDLIMREAGEGSGMKRALTATHLVALGVGGIIGSGIFVLTGRAAAEYAGPAIIISFILAGLASAFAGLCYAEFAALLPISGSAYTYAYATMGELMAWIIGWDLVLEYLFGASTVAVGWSGYVVSLLKDFNITIPDAICKAPLDYDPTKGIFATGNFLNVPAVLIIVLICALLIVGIQESAAFNNLAVFCKVAVILALIAFGWAFVDPSNWHPFIPDPQGPGKYGWDGILRGAGVIFFAYIGFDAVSTAAQEARNPSRDMPIGILGSLAICTVLYILVSMVLTGIVHYTKLDVPDPIAVAVNGAGPGLMWLRYPVKLAAVCGLSSVILVLLLGQPRIFYSMAHDGLLPEVFGRLHPKFQTPAVPTVVTGVFAAVIAGLFPIGMLGEMVSIGTLLAFVLVCGGVLLIRIRDAQPARDGHPYKLSGLLSPVVGVILLVLIVPGSFSSLNTMHANGQMPGSEFGLQMFTLVLFAICCLGFIPIGLKFAGLGPCADRPFMTPFAPLIPLMGILSCFHLMRGLPGETWLRLIVWMVIGLCIYFGYGRHHSRVQAAAAEG